ncbi:MBL fold metallo-hydrolase [Paenibacillus pinistramenti]|uniref:MBL fold metallo-hydrolase n=1 Tax=Paenibacillus pinistramenti TaxID=1768003 RepID=UPI001109AD35|nr:MBL fold metallo-hydrolase [Paenibacillus pinistramenti]
MSNPVKIEVLPAAEGDCILISTKNNNILIDAGDYDTYHDYLKPRLKTLALNQGRIDLFVVTHIDRDHIEGAIELLTDNTNSLNPSIIPIDQVWHNSYRHLQFPRMELLESLKLKFSEV